MKRVIGVLGSLLLHVFLVLALVHVTATAPRPPFYFDPEPITTASDNFHGAEEQRIEVKPIAADSQFAISGGEDCGPSGSYEGIGVMVSARVDRVTLVAPRSPAERAGLQTGDFILNLYMFDFDADYRAGKPLRLEVMRDNRRFYIWVRRGKVCRD